MRPHGFIAALLLLVAATAAAQPASAPTDAQIAAQAEAYMQAAVRHDQFTGAVLVARDGQPVVSKAYGKANYELDVPNTPSTVFQIASLTKQFTAAAILQLQERGKLKTGDRICAYLDDCPQAWQPITLRQLLTHTSGLRNYSSLDEWDEVLGRKTYRPIELVDLFARCRWNSRRARSSSTATPATSCLALSSSACPARRTATTCATTSSFRWA